MRRVLLAYLTGSKPSEIQFVEAERNKPELMTGGPSIEFSSSHSQDRGIIVTGPNPLGVDIEALERPIDYLGVAQRCFADEENADIRRVRGNARRLAFFNCWTGKEAYLKAIGVGLSKPLRSFAVQCAPDEPPGLKWDEETHTPRADYRFHRFTDNEFVVTVVLTDPTVEIEPVFHTLSPSSLRALRPIDETGPKWRPSPFSS